MTDLSYGDINKEVVFLNDKGTRLSISQFLTLTENKKIEIWFNSKNSCEYCNFHYLMMYLLETYVDIVDTACDITLEKGSVLSIYKTELLPINYYKKYVDCIKCLSREDRIKYKNKWLRLCEENSELRYCENGEIFSTAEDSFDEILENDKNGVFNLICDFGLSEDWLMDRKQRMVK